MDNRIYTEDSIQSISPREFTRLRPGVYCGSTEYSTQLLREIFSNCLDEHNIGHGNIITIKINTKENIYEVSDDGQGFPVNSKREDGETILQAAFDVMNTSGKYQEDGVYGGSALGLNGIGSKLTNFLSSWLMVETSDGSGKFECIRFEDGIFKEREVGKNNKGEHGTHVRWCPDPQFFQNKEVNISELKNLFTDVAALCPKLYIKLYIDNKEEIFHSENGLLDLIQKKVKDKEILSNRFYSKRTDGDNLIDFCLTYTDSYTEDLTAYVNYGLTDGGVHITTLKTGITRAINKYAREKGLLKEKEDNLSGAELSEGLVIIFNLKANGVQYDAQSKTRIVDIDKTLINTIISNDFTFWLENNEKDLKIIVDRALIARRAREAAKKAKDAARAGAKKKDKALKFDSKLTDCNEKKDRSKCEIYITEGDSASGNLKTARDNQYQAILPVRGKILNTQKATIAQIQANAEIMTMIEAFGLTIDHKTMKVTYNKEDLRYGKIIIMSDADVDGAHIKNLFYTFIWNFCPELIKDGYIYAGVPPLYRIILGKDTYIYLKDDAELEKFREEHKNSKYVVKHLKGLGEMDENDTDCLVNPDRRIIKQITVDDIQGTDLLFEQLMGSGVTARKTYIKEHSAEATYGV